MSHNLTDKQISRLRELRRYATLENALFDHVGPSDPDAPLPTKESEVTAFIRERTRIYRQSWILPIIDELLAEGRRR